MSNTPLFKMCKTFSDASADRVFDIFDLRNGQINLSRVKDDKINAWKVHRKQTDYLFVVDGIFKVGLGDEKDDGSVDVNFVHLSADNKCFIEIVPGIWHGYRLISDRGTMLYYLSDKYDPKDEEKQDPGDFGEDWD